MQVNFTKEDFETNFRGLLTDIELDEFFQKMDTVVDSDDIDEALTYFDTAIDAFGIEAIRDPEESSFGIALYVNRGDTYDCTILYDMKKESFEIGSWGDWFEKWESESK